MATLINTKTLRKQMSAVIRRVKRGESFSVLYRSRPAFRILPPTEDALGAGALDAEPLYRAKAVGRSKDGGSGQDHDEVLYGKKAR